MTFLPGHIIFHPEHGVGVVRKSDWRITDVSFVAAEDGSFDTRELRKTATIINGPGLIETHCPPDWDEPGLPINPRTSTVTDSRWTLPIPKPQFHRLDPHREVLDQIVRVCLTLILNSVGVFQRRTLVLDANSQPKSELAIDLHAARTWRATGTAHSFCVHFASASVGWQTGTCALCNADTASWRIAAAQMEDPRKRKKVQDSNLVTERKMRQCTGITGFFDRPRLHSDPRPLSLEEIDAASEIEEQAKRREPVSIARNEDLLEIRRIISESERRAVALVKRIGQLSLPLQDREWFIYANKIPNDRFKLGADGLILFRYQKNWQVLNEPEWRKRDRNDFAYRYCDPSRQDVFFQDYVFAYLKKGDSSGMTGEQQEAEESAEAAYVKPGHPKGCAHYVEQLWWYQHVNVLKGGPELWPVAGQKAPRIYWSAPGEKCPHGSLDARYCTACCELEWRIFVSDSPRRSKTLRLAVCKRHGFNCPNRLCKEHFHKHHGWKVAHDSRAVYRKLGKFFEPILTKAHETEFCLVCKFGHFATLEEIKEQEDFADSEIKRKGLAPLRYQKAEYVPPKYPAQDSILPLPVINSNLTAVENRNLLKEFARQWNQSEIYSGRIEEFESKTARRGNRAEPSVPWAEACDWIWKLYPDNGIVGTGDQKSADKILYRLDLYQNEGWAAEDIAKSESESTGKKITRDAVSKSLNRFYATVTRVRAILKGTKPAYYYLMGEAATLLGVSPETLAGYLAMNKSARLLAREIHKISDGVQASVDWLIPLRLLERLSSVFSRMSTATL